ncbi:translation initiation factor IF-2-like [Leopardus geoffroyi]|uniref:translation initiation factor IF-2-like n=1 Tax=Leopardus geoffroyi TaxID=46844 RepID=UPI001E261F40|nr:translation initiation factor IF-2-like [Leopardus geoffroyi]
MVPALRSPARQAARVGEEPRRVNRREVAGSGGGRPAGPLAPGLEVLAPRTRRRRQDRAPRPSARPRGGQAGDRKSPGGQSGRIVGVPGAPKPARYGRRQPLYELGETSLDLQKTTTKDLPTKFRQQQLPPEGVCARVCVSPRPAVTEPSSGARGLRAPGRCVGCGQPATPPGLPLEKGPGAPRLLRASAQLAPERWAEREGEKERRFPSAARVSPAPPRTRRKRRPRRPGSRCAAPGPRRPGRALASPSCETFSFWFAPPEKCSPGGGGGRTGLAAGGGGGGRGGSGARGSADEQRKCPARSAPARARRPASPEPPPRCDFGGPSPARQWWRRRRRRQMWPGCPEEPTMRGRQNKRVPLRLLSLLSLALPGRRAGSPASRGRSPGGPEPRAPRFPRGPPLYRPPPPRKV